MTTVRTVRYGVTRLPGDFWLPLRLDADEPLPPDRAPDVFMLGLCRTPSEAHARCRVDSRRVRARAQHRRDTVRIIHSEV